MHQKSRIYGAITKHTFCMQNIHCDFFLKKGYCSSKLKKSSCPKAGPWGTPLVMVFGSAFNKNNTKFINPFSVVEFPPDKLEWQETHRPL